MDVEVDKARIGHEAPANLKRHRAGHGWCCPPRRHNIAASSVLSPGRSGGAEVLPEPCVRWPTTGPRLLTRTARHQRVAITCAQIAIIPRNSVSDARTAVSSMMVRNDMAYPHEQKGNIVLFMFSVKAPAPFLCPSCPLCASATVFCIAAKIVMCHEQT